MADCLLCAVLLVPKKVSVWNTGKGLGGSSNINYMLYVRGNRHDYDEWATNGAQGWAYKDILPYFIKSEDQRNGEFVRTGHASLLLVRFSLIIVAADFTQLMQLVHCINPSPLNIPDTSQAPSGLHFPSSVTKPPLALLPLLQSYILYIT